jgi:hypothetical protein
MKKILFAFAAMIVLAACASEQAATPFESSETSNEVTFEVARNRHTEYSLYPLSFSTTNTRIRKWCYQKISNMINLRIPNNQLTLFFIIQS